MRRSALNREAALRNQRRIHFYESLALSFPVLFSIAKRILEIRETFSIVDRLSYFKATP